MATKHFESDAKALEYIGFLSATSRVDTSAWNITKLFSDDAKSLLKSPEEINRRFFEKINAQQAEAVVEGVVAVQPPKKTAKVKISDVALRRATKGMVLPAVTDAREKIKILTQRIKDYDRNVKHYQAAKDRSHSELEKLKKAWKKLSQAQAPDIKASIQKLVDEGFYTDFKYSKGYLWCLTPEIWMKLSQNSARIWGSPETVFNLGRYALRITIKNFSVEVFPHENNKFHEDSETACHPYRNAGRQLCFTGGGIEEALDNRDFYKFMVNYAALLRDGRGGIHYPPHQMFPNKQYQKNFYPKGK